jgi:hypothetical protein
MTPNEPDKKNMYCSTLIFYSGRDASHPEICFLYTTMFPGPVQETVGEAGFELETAALEFSVTQGT